MTTAAEARHRFPLIQPVERTFELKDVKKENVVVTVFSAAGKPAYGIQCHSYYVDAPELDETGFDWSGDFECRMVSYPSDRTYTTLFTESNNQERDWLSRARFFSSELQGACAMVPELGRRRSFKLQGMKITLEITEPTFTPKPDDPEGGLDSLKLKVSVVRDAKAWRRIAAITPIPNPIPAGCDPSHIPPILNIGDPR
jgi:hypothetical protein